MTDAIRHRAPDDSGFHFDLQTALGHRRLSIIDVAGGRQPMSNEDGTLSIVYNGEVFNHSDLRPELERAGHRFQTHCDTEAILHAYEQSGPECLTRFRGMFAFAIWDGVRKKTSVSEFRHWRLGFAWLSAEQAARAPETGSLAGGG
jgi:asparagine synthetase B (glutamine-hydrolysing)